MAELNGAQRGAAVQLNIPLHKIRVNSGSLRDHVQKDTEKYAQLLHSIKKTGLINAISVREIVDPANPDAGVFYGLVDGLHRYTACMDAGFDVIPATVTNIKDADLLDAQIIANLQKIDTTSKQYRESILTMLRSNPMSTEMEIADRLGVSITWLRNTLSLKKLTEKIQELISAGTLGLTNAYQLAKLPTQKQEDLLQQAISMAPNEFIPLSQGIIKELETAKREGRAAKTDEFIPSPRLQKTADFTNEIDCFSKGKFEDSKVYQLLGSETEPKAVALKVLKWSMHLDEKSLAEDKMAHEKRLSDAKVAKENREKERLEKKEKAAKDAMMQLS